MIHVCFGLSDKDGRYSKFTGTAILSMFENTFSEVTVHILHDNTLSNDNRDKISYIAGRYGQIIKFYNVEEICANEIERIKKIFSNYPYLGKLTIGSFYRILSSQVIKNDIEKIIYLDSDLVVNLDINELWQINLKDNPLAAVPEFSIGTTSAELLLVKDEIIDAEDYFNSGVLLINLKQIRQNETENLERGIQFLAKNFQYGNFDQEILNYCFSKNYLKLPNKFNFFVRFSRKLNETQIDKRVYHYSAQDLGTDFRDVRFKLWFNYFEKTPFFNKEIIGRLDEEIRRMDARQKNLAVQLSTAMSGKIRAFFTATYNVDAIKKIFSVKDDEEIIPHVNQESINALINSMRESRGKKVFFIFFGRYYQLRADLMRAGFIEGRDFINVANFLSDANGVKLNTYNLVRSM